MPVQHFYQPKKLALAITLAVSCAQFTQAEEVPANVPTPGALTALLDTFINDPDTVKTPIDKKGYAEPFSERSDLLIVTGGTAFSVDGSSLDRDSLVLEAGLDVGISARHTLGVGYSGEIGSNSRNHGLIGQWQMSF